MQDAEDDNPKDRRHFDSLAARMAMADDLRSAIGHFLADFAVFESIYLTAILKSVSHDAIVIEHLPELMDLSQRLKLLKYLGVARNLPEPLIDEIRDVTKAANELRDLRNEIAHGAAVLSTPFLTDPNSPDIVAGVQRPRSKRMVPDSPIDDPKDVLALQRKWMHSADKIRSFIPSVTQLQHASMQLANKLECYRRGEPWTRLVVAKVEVPKWR